MFEAAAELLSKAKRVLVSGHISPDGDSVGSMIAMAHFLRVAGIDAVAAADVKALGKPGFLDEVELMLPLKKLKRRRFDLVVAVDCATLQRLPVEVRSFAEKLPVVCIDHHAVGVEFGAARIIDAAASSAGEIVMRFAEFMKWPLDRVSAEALWVALVTDSGRFAYDSTTPATMRAAAKLLEQGVRTAFINDILYGQFPARAIELKRRAWRSLHVWKNRRVAEVTLTRDDFRDVRGTKAEAEDIIEIPRSVTRNQIALFFYQIPDRTHETRVSIRTRAPYDAAALAAKFGGGGHVRAAGCTVVGSLALAKRQLRKAVKELLV